ncbi:hypothetical protein H4R24_003375 [Coemansia sp. RSA 988]|nr:hypothetical protein H4R24_003375 [Coemansia sp. RSA 988]
MAGNKYYTAGTQPSSKMSSDSGACVDDRNKNGKDLGGKSTLAMQIAQHPADQHVRAHVLGDGNQDDGVMWPLNINYYGYPSPDIAAETAANGSWERSEFASAKSDIYNCILADKKQSM